MAHAPNDRLAPAPRPTGSARGRGLRAVRWVLGAAMCLTLAAALYLTTQGLGIWDPSAAARVKELAGEDQEIAWIEPATNTDDWSQLVNGLTRLQADWPTIRGPLGELKVDLGPDSSRAFPQLTADVAEIALSFAEAPVRTLWVRWYKISGDNPTEAWVEKLRTRKRPPLAIIGGGTSDRAYRLARALVQARDTGWHGKPPLFLITTATAETDRPPVVDASDPTPGKSLTGVYAGRTFRFCFTNGAMVRAVLGFLRENPHAWIEPAPEPSALASAGAVTAGDPFAALAFLHAAGHVTPKLFTVSWEDDSYSRDLEVLFRIHCHHWHPLAQPFDLGTLPYSVGDAYEPNAAEQTSVDVFLSQHTPPPRSILVLPASVQRMRRYLGFLCKQAPQAARNLVVVNGDAITFHNVYRDRDFAWNVLDLPVSVVFFAHRNPVDPDAAATWSFAWQRDTRKKHSTTGTHDLLLFRDMIEAMLYAAFDKDVLLGDADRVRDRLWHTCWRDIGQHNGAADPRNHRVQNSLVHPDPLLTGRELFDEAGDRRPGTGEHIVWLRPNFREDRLSLLQPCTISVWSLSTNADGPTWHQIDSHSPPYNQARVDDS